MTQVRPVDDRPVDDRPDHDGPNHDRPNNDRFVVDRPEDDPRPVADFFALGHFGVIALTILFAIFPAK